MWSGTADSEDDLDESRRRSIELALTQHSAGDAYARAEDDDDDDDDDDNDDDDDDSDAEIAVPAEGGARGKPEAMAAKLASVARLQQKMDELESEKDVEVVAEPLDDPLDATMETVDTVATVETKDTAATPSATPKKKRKTPTSNKKSTSQVNHAHPSMDDPVKPVSGSEYENLEQLMIQFCRVPLLAEFSRPVALLHPEVSLRAVIAVRDIFSPLTSPVALAHVSVLQDRRAPCGFRPRLP